MADTISGTRFTSHLANRTTYDAEILRDVRPFDNPWMTRVPRGAWEAYNNSTLIQDRFRHVDAPMDRQWEAFDPGNCSIQQCDPEENEIGYGHTRLTYSLKRQSWRSPLFCFDQEMTKVLAREQMAQIVEDVLRPATFRITSNLYRMDAAAIADRKMMATANMDAFDFEWNITNNRVSGITVTSGANAPTSKLTHEMIKQRYYDQMLLGAFGKNPEDMGNMLEVITDLDTLYEIERTSNIIQGSNPSVTAWRWTSMADNAKFFKYGWSGALGNAAMVVDKMPLRFNRIATGVYQFVPPYLNVEIDPADGGGLRSDVNPAYHLANFQMHYIYHRESFTALWFRAAALHGKMSFNVRDFTGNWQFVTNDLGVANPRRNKGYFYADFMLGIKPRYTEWLELIFSERDPVVITAIAKTTADQPSNAWGDGQNATFPGCDPTTTYTHQVRVVVRAADGVISIPANGISCGTTTVANAAMLSTDAPGSAVAPVDPANITDTEYNNQITGIAANLNADAAAGALGTWSNNAGTLQLAGTTCSSIGVAWEV